MDIFHFVEIRLRIAILYVYVYSDQIFSRVVFTPLICKSEISAYAQLVILIVFIIDISIWRKSHSLYLQYMLLIKAKWKNKQKNNFNRNEKIINKLNIKTKNQDDKSVNGIGAA